MKENGLKTDHQRRIDVIFAQPVAFMIDLSVMHSASVGFLFLIGLAFPGFNFQNAGAVVSDLNLETGSVLVGIFPIQATVQAEQFNSYDVYIGFADGLPDTWDLTIHRRPLVNGGLLASWNTIQIIDGVDLSRIVLGLMDDTAHEWIVSDLEVRSSSPLDPIQAPTTTGAASPIASLLVSTVNLTQIAATDTPFSANPGSLSQADFQGALLYGAGISLGVFILFGFYLAFRKRPRRR